MTKSRNVFLLAGILLLAAVSPGQQKPVGDGSAAKSSKPDPAAAIAEMRQQFSAELKQSIREEFQRLKQELRHELRQELKMDLKQELRQELKMELKMELKQELSYR